MVFIITLVLVCCGSVGTRAARSGVMTVQMKTSELRTTPSGLGRVVTTVKLGDRLTVLEDQGCWSLVSTETGLTGWIPNSSLVRGKVDIGSGDRDARVAASDDEMSLATKGFTSQVEADFKNQHQDVDFTWVDKMIGMDVSTAEMLKFLEQGEVQAGKGGAQ